MRNFRSWRFPSQSHYLTMYILTTSSDNLRMVSHPPDVHILSGWICDLDLFWALTMLTSERPIGFSTHQGKQQRIPMEQPKISPHRTQIQKRIEERFLSIESKTE